MAPIASSDHRQFWKHDIKIARDYNKTLHSEKDLQLNELIAEDLAEFNENQEPFRGKKFHVFWNVLSVLQEQ